MLSHKLSKLSQLSDESIDSQDFNVGKHKLLAEIGRRQEKRDVEQLSTRESLRLFTMRVSRRLVPTHQRVVAFFVVITFLVSTNFIAQAAVPGDILYPLKLTFERAELALAFSPESESRVHLRHVDKRLMELNIVVLQHDDRNKSANISILVRKIENNITAAGNSLNVVNEEQKNSGSVDIVQLAKDINLKATEAIQALETQKIALADPIELIIDADVFATSTDEIIEGGEEVIILESNESVEQNVEEVITEVQEANETVSLLALRLMISLADNGGDDSEVKEVMRSLITKYRSDYNSLLVEAEFISSEFPVHKLDLLEQLTLVKGLLDTANDLLLVHELTESYFKASAAREHLVDAFAIETELEKMNGFTIPEPEVIEEILEPTVNTELEGGVIVQGVVVDEVVVDGTLEELTEVEEVIEPPVNLIDGVEVEFNTNTEKFGDGS